MKTSRKTLSFSKTIAALNLETMISRLPSTLSHNDQRYECPAASPSACCASSSCIRFSFQWGIGNAAAWKGEKEKKLSGSVKDARTNIHLERCVYGPYEMHYTRTIDSVAYSTELEREQEKAKGALLTRAQSAVLGKHIGEKTTGSRCLLPF